MKQAAQNAAQLPQQLAADPQFRAVFEGWHDLPPAVKAGILAMVRATRDCGG